MQKLFSPAIAVMDRLSYSKKFVVLGLLSMLAVMVVIINLYQNLHKIIDDSEHQLDGLKQVKTVTQAIQSIQHHRALSSAVIAGMEIFHDDMLSQAHNINLTLDQTEQTLPAVSSIDSLFKEAKSQWLQIQQNGAHVNLETNHKDHSNLINRMFALQEAISDEALLPTDPDIDSYHLIMLLSQNLPETLENMSQINAYSLVFLVQHRIDSEQKILLWGLRFLNERGLDQITSMIQHTSLYNPKLEQLLGSIQENINITGQHISQQVIPDIVDETFKQNPESLHLTLTNSVNLAYSQIYDHLIPAAEELIKHRIAQAQQTLWLSTVIPGCLFLLILYFAIGAHISVTRGIASLVKATRACVGGDFRQRLPITRQDEIGLMADSFNQLADSFNTLLEQQLYDQIRLQSIFDTALDAVLQMDAEGNLLTWNRTAEQMFGWSINEIRGHPLHEIVLPKRFHEVHLKSLKHYQDTGEEAVLNKRIEIAAINRDGREFPIEIAITPNYLKNKVEFSTFIRDISDHKKTLLTLQNSEQRYRALFESSRDALLTLSPTRGFLSGNPAAIQLFGYGDEQEFLGQTPASLSPEHQTDGALSAELAFQNIKTALETGSNTYEWIYRRMDGHTFLAEVQLSRIEINHEIILQATIRDITEKKRAKTALINSEARTRAVLRTMSDVVILIDMYGNILLVNDAIYDLFGYEEEELLGQNINMLMPEPYHSDHDGYLLRHDKTKDKVIIGRRVEVEGQHKSGQLIPIELSVNELVDDEGNTYLGVIRDISLRKATENAREAARLEALHLAQAKSAFLANMSHEIRTPLNAIIGLATMNTRDLHCNQLHENNTRIHDAGLHLLNIVNDILDFSKIEAGKLTLDLQPFQLRTLVDETISLIELRAQEKQLSLELIYPNDLPAWVYGDPLRLRQILVNLLSNAVKFTQSGSVQLSISRHQDNTVIRLTDSGIGMTAEQIARMFTAFEQADNSTTRQFGGSGLGLAISRNLARLMNGEIRVESTPGMGSTFTLTLPLPITAAGAEHQMICPKDGSRLNGINILAAEDVSLNRLVLEDLLKHEGANVTFAENGQQVLDILGTNTFSHFDIVLMDIQMPLMDGYQATRLLLKQCPDLPIIGLTAHAMPEERQRCLEAGMRDRITKPIIANELVNAILKHIARPLVNDTLTEKSVISECCMPETESESDIEDKPIIIAPTIIDWPAMQQRFDGRQSFIDKLINNALDGNQEAALEKLKNAVEEQDFASIKFIAHSLKGLASIFEAQTLLDQAQQTEQAAKNDSEQTCALGEQLAFTLQSLIEELKRHHPS